MGFRYRKSKKILPGTRMNISKSGVSVSTKLGGGLSYRTQIVGGKKRKRKRTPSTAPVPLRAWWIIVAIILIMSLGANTNPDVEKTALTCGLVGLLMLVVTIVTFVGRIVNRSSRQKDEQPEDAE